LNKLDPK